MPQSDFTWVTFDEQFTANNPVATRPFTVDDFVVDAHHDDASRTAEGYLLILARDVEHGNHQFEINGRDLPSFDLPPDGDGEWQTWMDRIPEGFLRTGENRLTIRRTSDDDFTVSAVAVHWRECG